MAKRRPRKSANKNGKSLFDSVDESLLQAIPLRQAAQERYLNYSLSVITSRALPDVRDGLKPVQRRTLYTMHQQGLSATAKHRKCAKVVGDVMGNYHPHGDSSIYEALVRMAQPFSMRMPLIDGSGNFGSVDGDNAAAMRYTECRMTPIASEVLADLATRTVPFKANYDGTREEPVVLPSRLPNLLLNGTTGIAVGMATNIPPHNLKEICAALLKLLRDPEIKDYQLVANDAIQGPDFPTGGQIINTKEELREIYQNGQGTIKLRGTAKEGEQSTRSNRILQIDSIPYGVNKALLVERMAELVFDGKLPLVTEVRDLSTDEIRIDLFLKKDADESKVLAFLYKHTDLQKNFNVNMTCLVPTENPELGTPERLSLKEMLWHFLHFRLEVVTRRLENELAALERRLHILEGFALIFDALDEIIKIIRNSDGKADAATKIMKRFPAEEGGLDEDQTDAILELKLYRLARLEINLIRDELKDKNKRARQIRKLLREDTQDTNASGRWKIVREEIESLVTTYGKDQTARRLSAIDSNETEIEYSEEDFIVAEDCHVLVTRDGWVKRQKQIADPSKSRLRQGDEVLAVLAGDTRATIGFFSSLGVCYTTRFIDLPASTGFGEPIQKLFKMKDGERIVSVMSFDPRVVGGNIHEDPKHPDYCPEIHALAASTNGFALRFGLAPYAEPSTRSGRRYARVATDASIVDVIAISGSEVILAVSNQCRAIVCDSEEVNYLSGPGKGVTLIRLAKDDELLGFKASSGDRDLLTVETNRGAKKTISTAKYRKTSRGGRGVEIQKNGKIAKILSPPPAAPEPFEDS
ncbi:DNA gyrase/topoisomerase IV subunit A [Roseiconus lacunae]|uniref:DNA topoisomerase (ATP-hydrolyzing) n=1 Tax=Roseiconus lacunae TaxID=2605694 RepID=A0ABT7PKV9_9BACT|nr:DNA topoisomerase (ATP-hydrolyzing) [Roseiconus lacunae]MCD0461036.1 DNA topoisomerase 4 subunit A [Roseiconus lacunae]MDM4016939.1 DNA topoisomerase 4 subunit A [Roseiconus lacunae]